MLIADAGLGPHSPLLRLRHLRRTQAWTLAAVATASVAGGVVLLAGEWRGWNAFAHAFAWQCVIWGVIDLVFAGLGVAQAVRADRRPPCPQAEADEFLAAEKLAKSLRFNHRLNVGYVAVAALLLAWAGGAADPTIAGHGVGVLVQGGFLFVLDLVTLKRLNQLQSAPA